MSHYYPDEKPSLIEEAAEWAEEADLAPEVESEPFGLEPVMDEHPTVEPTPVPTDAEGTPQPEQAPASIPPTQVRHPWRAALRTGLAVVVALPLVDAVVREWIQTFLPPQWTWVPALWGGVVGVALLITRVLNLKAVNDLLPDWLQPAPTKTDAELPADAPAELPAGSGSSTAG